MGASLTGKSGTRHVIQTDVRDGHVLLEVRDRLRARDEQDVWRAVRRFDLLGKVKR